MNLNWDLPMGTAAWVMNLAVSGLALVFPLSAPAPAGRPDRGPAAGANGVLSNGTGFPAITVPGGFSAPTASAPLGVPIGIELLGPEWSEPRLIELAFAFEQATQYRKPPAATPPLDR